VITKDTRLPPKGFVAGPTTPVIGATFGDGFDDVPVMLPVPADLGPEAGTLTLVATVLYQATMPEMIDEHANANKTDRRGQTLKTIYAATKSAEPLPIATTQASVVLPEVTSMMPPPPPKSSSGCSCNASPGPSGPGFFVVLLLLLRRRNFTV